MAGLKLNLLEAIVALVTLVVMPLIFRLELFAGHDILAVIAVVFVLVASGRLYWMSFKRALNIGDRQ